MARPKMSELQEAGEHLARLTGQPLTVRYRWDGRPGLYLGREEISPPGLTAGELDKWLWAFTAGVEFTTRPVVAGCPSHR
jgi:hypothetical protein